MATSVNESMPILIVSSSWRIIKATQAAQKLLENQNNIVGSQLDELFNFPSSFLEQHKIDDGISVQVTLRLKGKAQYLLSFYDVAHNDISIHITDLTSHYCQNPLEDEQTRILRHAVNSANLGIWCYDLVSKHAYFSPKFKALIGLPASAELDWESLKSMIYYEDRSLFAELLAHHIEQGLMIQFEFRIEVRGAIRWFEFKGEQVKYCIKTHNVYGILADCTHEKDMLVALHDAEESKQLAMQAGKIGTWRAIKVANQWVCNWDRQANSIFKLEDDDIGNLPKWQQSLHPDDKARVTEALQNSLQTGDTFEQRYRSVLAEGDVIVLYAKGVVGCDEHGDPKRIDGVVIDQTDVYIAQKKLQHINQELEQRVAERTADLEAAIIKAEQANRTKSDFLSMMSHELRTPMNGIIGALDLINLSELNEDNQELIETATVSANNLVAILNDILDLAKVEQGKLELESYPYSPSQMLNNIVKTFSAHANDKSVKLVVLEATDLPLKVTGDENRVRQVIFNIVSNAIKFSVPTRAEGALVSIEVSWRTEGVALSHLIFTISDNGIGITPEVQKKLFTPFTQAERSITRRFGGTGLGLAICGKLVDLMGGKISLTSKPNQGSSFAITIPVWQGHTPQPLEPTFKTLYLLHSSDQQAPEIQQLSNCCHKACEQVIVIENISQAKPEKDTALIMTVTANEEITQGANQPVSLPTLAFVTPALHTTSTEQQLQVDMVRSLYPHTQHSFMQLLKKLRQTTKPVPVDSLDDLTPLDELDSLLTQTKDSNCNEQSDAGKTILLAEDNPFNQKLIVKQLARLQLNCDIASNGQEALDKFKNNDYSLLLTDCHMPEMDGYELTKHIRELEQQQQRTAIPIVAVTGAAMKGDKENCIDSGMNDYVSKPVRLMELKDTLYKWLNTEDSNE